MASRDIRSGLAALSRWLWACALLVAACGRESKVPVEYDIGWLLETQKAVARDDEATFGDPDRAAVLFFVDCRHLANTIEVAVGSRDDWEDGAAISCRDDKMVVTATAAVHRKVEVFLKALAMIRDGERRRAELVGGSVQHLLPPLEGTYAVSHVEELVRTFHALSRFGTMEDLEGLSAVRNKDGEWIRNKKPSGIRPEGLRASLQQYVDLQRLRFESSGAFAMRDEQTLPPGEITGKWTEDNGRVVATVSVGGQEGNMEFIRGRDALYLIYNGHAVRLRRVD